MDKEYIDKNEILYQMSIGLIPQDYEWTRAYALARKLIKDAPTEDVEPVRHGEWLHKNGEMYCSICSGEALMDEVYYQSPYCPECGAKMDGGNKTITNKYPRCQKCVYEVTCTRDYDNEGACRSYKRDPKDGGYYG